MNICIGECQKYTIKMFLFTPVLDFGHAWFSIDCNIPVGGVTIHVLTPEQVV